MTRFRSILLFLILALFCGALAAQDGFYLRNGDRVVFYGDSITNQRLYGQFVETYVLTRFPKLKVDFIQSGWGGDRVSGGGGGKIDQRLERDVFAYKPTVMTVMLGMNDAGYRPFDPELFQRYASGYEHIVGAVKSRVPGIRMTLIQPSPFDDVTRPPEFDGGYNGVLVRYGEFVKQLAAREKLDSADLNTAVVEMLRKAYATNPELAQKIIPDRVHPGPGGHIIMAEALLEAWNAPKLVSSIEIDAAGKQFKAENAKVSELQVQNGVSWTQQDEALPMPIEWANDALALAVRSSDFVDALDSQMLRVRGLAAPRVRLKIDGEDLGSFTPEQLASGINLATMPTPMIKQAAKVHTLTIKHNTVHEMRWRTIQTPLADEGLANLKTAMDALDKLEAELVQQQRAAAQPKPHRFELIPE